ncbi:MAG: hypothetical protein R3C53_13635 [Pirellulaceae bacterium]
MSCLRAAVCIACVFVLSSVAMAQEPFMVATGRLECENDPNQTSDDRGEYGYGCDLLHATNKTWLEQNATPFCGMGGEQAIYVDLGCIPAMGGVKTAYTVCKVKWINTYLGTDNVLRKIGVERTGATYCQARDAVAVASAAWENYYVNGMNGTKYGPLQSSIETSSCPATPCGEVASHLAPCHNAVPCGMCQPACSPVIQPYTRNCIRACVPDIRCTPRQPRCRLFGRR